MVSLREFFRKLDGYARSRCRATSSSARATSRRWSFRRVFETTSGMAGNLSELAVDRIGRESFLQRGTGRRLEWVTAADVEARR